MISFYHNLTIGWHTVKSYVSEQGLPNHGTFKTFEVHKTKKNIEIFLMLTYNVSQILMITINDHRNEYGVHSFS